MVRAPRIRWREIVPSRWAWVHLLATPSSYLLVLALIATLVAKAHVLRGLDEIGFWVGRWLAAGMADVAVFLGLAAVLALGEHLSRRLVIITLPIALAVTTLAVINAGYLAITGEQLSTQVLALAIDRFGDVRGMASATIHPGAGWVIAGLAVIALPPTAGVLALRRAQRPLGLAAAGELRTRAASVCALVALVLAVFVPAPRRIAGLYANAVTRVGWGAAVGSTSWNGGIGLFAGYAPRALIDDATLAALRAGAHQNVVLVVLESTRRDATDLAGASAPARTPNLVALAARGLEITHGRAVVPHTSKSLWSMLCGRLPLLQPTVYETSPSIDVQCLPEILTSAGWRTGFLQSAVGDFEDRPRLVHNLGFHDFVAANRFTDRVLGYLATDDEALPAKLGAWIDAAPGAPFMATVLTSGTHHPYALSATAQQRIAAGGGAATSDRERYARQIEAADHMLGEIVEQLRTRGLVDRTILIVVGDHGEGFGEKGVRQHASNYYEEGLRVPWVLAGPGVPNHRLDASASLLDLAPTLLELLGARVSPDVLPTTPARSLLSAGAEPRVLPFACFFDESCRGFVVGTTKVVMLPNAGQTFAFDLALDPAEERPRALTGAEDVLRDQVQRQIDLHRTRSWPRLRATMLAYPPWRCLADQICWYAGPRS